jgi:polar amino acid transport system permease protein
MPQPPKSRPNPQKRNVLIMRLARAPWWVLFVAAGMLLFVIAVAESTTYQLAWREVSRGIWVTIWVTLVAYSLALVLGLILALLRRPSTSLLYNLLVYQPATAFVEVVRGIPTLVLVFYFALALVPILVGLANDLGENMLAGGVSLFGLAEGLAALRVRDVPMVYRAILALAISYGAFLSEVFRAGIDSVDIGQHEAARSLGMSRWQIMRHIVLPQALRNVLPALGNDFIAMLKESSLVSVVGVTDVTRQGQTFAAATFTFFQAYNVVALTYLTLTLSLALLVRGLERHLQRHRQ